MNLDPHEILYGDPPHAERYYSLLRSLDLGRDAACLRSRSEGPTPADSEELLAAYLGASGRLRAQFLPLEVDSLAALQELLLRPPPELRDEAGQRLVRSLNERLVEESTAPKGAAQAAASFCATCDAELRTLREALALRFARPPLPLKVWHVPALRWHGRASYRRLADDSIGRIIATDLSQGSAHALCQVFHEECHAWSDRGVNAHHGGTRSTRASEDGFLVHQAVERAAVALGAEIIEEHAPHLQEAYSGWRRRFSC